MMLSANIFYSIYNTFFNIVSLFIGLSAVFLVRNSREFRGLFQMQLGALILILLTYISTHNHLLYAIGLNYIFSAFVYSILSLLISVIWLNSASEIYAERTANHELLTFYVSLGLSACVYYCFFDYNLEYINFLSSFFIIIGAFLTFCSCLLHMFQNRSIGYFLLLASVLLLLLKLVVSAYFYQYGWLNLNIFNWLWIYIFVIAVIFIRFELDKNDLQKCWNTIDKLHLQINNMIDSSPFPIIIAKITDHKLLMINERAALMFGLTKKELSYHRLSDFFVDEQNRLHFFDQLTAKHEVNDYDMMVCNLLNGNPFWLSVSAKTIEYNNELVLYLAFQDITSRKKRENTLQNQADKDPLTLAWNRRYFENTVPEYIKQNIKNAQNFSLLLIDADKFKKINDTYGHKIGDKVLIELAEICSHSLRDGDVVARYGGEEFVIYLNDTDSVSAYKVAERLRSNIENASVQSDSGKNINITVSIGVVSSEKTSSLEILLRQVDEAMYLAKHNGRNQVALYDEEQIKKIRPHKKKSVIRNTHPVFQNEDNEEFSLLDSYDNKF